jgi:hypothetical protein
MSKKLYCVDKEYKLIVEVYPEEYDIDTDHPMLLYFDNEIEAVEKLLSLLRKEVETYEDILENLKGESNV